MQPGNARSFNINKQLTFCHISRSLKVFIDEIKSWDFLNLNSTGNATMYKHTCSVKKEQEQEVVIWSKKDRRLSRGTAPAQS